MTPPKETTIIQPALELRELLRQKMLEQPTTEERLSFSDGFHSALAFAIHQIDHLAQPAPVEQDVERAIREALPGVHILISDGHYWLAAERLAAALSTLTPAQAEGFKAGDYNYTQLFNAIAAATSVYGGGTGVNVSVKAFLAALKESDYG